MSQHAHVHYIHAVHVRDCAHERVRGRVYDEPWNVGGGYGCDGIEVGEEGVVLVLVPKDAGCGHDVDETVHVEPGADYAGYEDCD